MEQNKGPAGTGLEFVGPPGWGPHKPWRSTRKSGGPPQWVLVAVGLVAVLALVAGVTVFSSADSSQAATAAAPTQDPVKPTTPAPKSEFASASDTAAAGIITDDPTCTAWTGVSDALTAAEQTSWSGRDPALPATAWTADRRTSYDSVATAMRAAADQADPLAKQTPHRVIRELYEQTVAYLRAYADSIPTYTATADHLALVGGATNAALSSICQAIANGSATARAGLIPPAAPPTASTPAAAGAARFFQPPTDPVCAQWHSMVAKYTGEFAAWRGTDASAAATQWGPQQRAISQEVIPTMMAFADEVEGLARGTSNGVFQDFTTLAGEYRRAYAAALPTYTPADAFLTQASSGATLAIDEACTATEG